MASKSCEARAAVNTIKNGSTEEPTCGLTWLHNILVMRMAHLALTPPAAFLPCLGEPSVTFTSWIRIFENFMLVVNDDALSDARKRALLIHCLRTEGQRLFYTLPVDEDRYSAAVAALTDFFMPKVNVVFKLYKFHQ